MRSLKRGIGGMVWPLLLITAFYAAPLTAWQLSGSLDFTQRSGFC
jgi:hypothetical protein